MSAELKDLRACRKNAYDQLRLAVAAKIKADGVPAKAAWSAALIWIAPHLGMDPGKVHVKQLSAGKCRRLTRLAAEYQWLIENRGKRGLSED